MSPQEAAPLLGMRHPFPAQKLFGQVRNFSAEELDGALIRLAELDRALKGGSRLANELELERALVEITAARLRRGERRALRSPTRAGDELRRLRLLAGAGVPVQSAAGDRAVDQLRQRAVLLLGRRRVALRGRRGEALGERLDRRLVAQVLEPLFGGGADALLLLLDIGHNAKKCPLRRARQG